MHPTALGEVHTTSSQAAEPPAAGHACTVADATSSARKPRPPPMRVMVSRLLTEAGPAEEIVGKPAPLNTPRASEDVTPSTVADALSLIAGGNPPVASSDKHLAHPAGEVGTVTEPQEIPPTVIFSSL
jgi:hypothetical protein